MQEGLAETRSVGGKTGRLYQHLVCARDHLVLVYCRGGRFDRSSRAADRGAAAGETGVILSIEHIPKIWDREIGVPVETPDQTRRIGSLIEDTA